MNSLKYIMGEMVKPLGKSTLIVICQLMTLIINEIRLSAPTLKHALLNN